VHLFSLRNFAIGTAYSKIEPLAAVILGNVTSVGATVTILAGLAGVVVISVVHAPRAAGGLVALLTGRYVLTGFAFGACFGLSTVLYRAASLSIAVDGSPGFLMQAGLTLLCVTGFRP
jgi:hypothetical protein